MARFEFCLRKTYNNMRIRKLITYLEQPVDNTSLVLFRMVFGLLIAVESFGAILTGWVRRGLMDPEFTFTFIGFEWLQPLPGFGMYWYYGLMGSMGLLVMVGWYYRFGLSVFTLMWTGTYLMQKTSYNNHYYLLILLCFLMLLVPAHKNASLDTRLGRVSYSTTCPKWAVDIFKWQLLIVYTYAALAKLYPGWLEGDFISYVFTTKAHYPVVGSLLQQEWLHKMVIIGGFVYDLSIIPMIYWSVTRKAGVIISIGFHLFNSVVFGIGIFPYLMLGSFMLFFPTKSWRGRIPGYKNVDNQSANNKAHKALIFSLLGGYFLLQLWLPLRHHFIRGDVLRTEEGHRMAWRMMLRSKYGDTTFRVINKQTGEEWMVDPKDHLTNKQAFKMGARPDMTWQFARYLRKHYASQGINEIEVYADAKVYINGEPISTLIDPEVDLLSVQWKRFGHNPWIVVEN